MKVKKAVGVSEFQRKEFKLLDIPEQWSAHLGEVPERFTCSVFGFTANGKTDYAMQLAKMLAKLGNVLYNSREQGISKSLQMCINRNKMQEVNGKVVFASDSYEELIMRLSKRKSARFIIIDSRDQMNISYEQFNELELRYPKKSFIILMYEKGAKPKGEHGNNIHYRCDIKVRVRAFVASNEGRFGGNQDFVIWEEGAKRVRDKIRELRQIPTM